MKVNAKRLAFLIAGISIFSVGAFAFIGAHDKVKVTFDHPVYVQGDKLAPGKYTIETMEDKESNNNVLEVYGKNNQKFKTTFTTIDAKKVNNGADTTHVTLVNVGGEYFLDKIFIQGRINGYQVLLPDKIQSAVSSGSSKSEDLAGTSQKAS